MFGGYAEAYYVEDHPVEMVREESVAKEEEPMPKHYLPSNVLPDPWLTHSKCPRDFIMFAEFAQVEGPNPVFTIPKETGTQLNMIDFAVCLMTVDYHGFAESTKFVLPGDAKRIMSDHKLGYFAYVHHFQLHDIEARGFARPVCLAYVTSDERKLYAHYEEMSSAFSKVTKYMKYGNLKLFVTDVTHKLSDLHYTKERLREWRAYQQRHLESGDSLVEGANLEPFDAGDSSLLSSVDVSYLEGLVVDLRAVLTTASGRLTDLSIEERMSKLRKQWQVKEMPCGKMNKSSAVSSSLGDHIDFTFLSNIENESGEDYKPQLVRAASGKERDFHRILRSVLELCCWGSREAIDRLCNIYKYFCRDFATLSQEKKEAALIEPAEGLVTVGRLLAVNFLHNLGIGSCCHVNGGDCARNQPGHGPLLRKWLSRETLDSLHTDDLSELEEDGGMVTPAFIMGSALLEQHDVGPEILLSPDEQRDFESAEEDSSSSSSEPKPDSDSIQASPIHRVSVASFADHVYSLSPSSPGYGMLRFVQQYRCCLHILFALLSGRPLIIVGASRQQRDVETLVRTLRILIPSHFSSRHQVNAWFTEDLQHSDLNHLKLIGLARLDRRPTSQLIPEHYKEKVTILDIEKSTFSGPRYQGGLLQGIYDKRKGHHSDQSFLAFIHSILLEYGCEAFIYYRYLYQSSKSSQSHMSKEDMDFLIQLGLSADDASIVQNFVRCIQPAW